MCHMLKNLAFTKIVIWQVTPVDISSELQIKETSEALKELHIQGVTERRGQTSSTSQNNNTHTNMCTEIFNLRVIAERADL
jgi:aryl-alcohol dehydrogenase-like predicted oxidoreductase